MEANLILKNDTSLGEGPVWDHGSNTLYWVDIEKGFLQAFGYHSGENHIYRMNEFVGAAVPTTDGRVIAALKNRIVIYDPKSGQEELFCEPEPGQHTNRFNDGKCDPQGRFWIGSTQIDHKDPSGVLYSVESNGSFTARLVDLTISNGMAWTADSKTMYFIDSPTLAVQAFDFVPGSGSIHYREHVLTFSADQGVPDGMCIDDQGNLWIAFYGAGKVGCYNPANGQELAVIVVPARNTTSCCFGGPEMDRLFITTAKRDDPDGGGLYCCKPGVTGPRPHFFKI